MQKVKIKSSAQFNILPPPKRNKFYLLTHILALFSILFAAPKFSYAQALECSLGIPSAVAQKLIEKQSLIDEFIANLQNEEYAASRFAGVPVRFTVISGPTSPTLIDSE
jgi:hypothetical protein